MVVLQYNKTYDELTRDEIIAVIRTYAEDRYDKSTVKTAALQKLSDISIDHDYGWDSETLFYFSADNVTKAIVCFRSNEVVPTEFNHIRPRRWADFEKIVPQIPEIVIDEDEQSEDPNLKIMRLLEGQDKTINNLCAAGETAYSRKFSQLNKIKVEFDDNVPHFIALMEEWASSNQIYDEDQIIRKASATITQSAQGMSIREALAISPATSWPDFKQKLQELLGQDKSFYRKQFRSLQKQEHETFGQYLAKLTMNFKYAYSLQVISKHDRTQIKTQFIDNLEQPLKGFLESEDLKDEIPFTNLAARDEQLFRAHGMNGANEQNICHIRSQRKKPEIDVKSIMAETQRQNQEFFNVILDSQKNFMREIMNTMRSSCSVNAIQNSSQNGYKKTPPTKERREKMKTFICHKWERNECPYTSERCYFKHAKN